MTFVIIFISGCATAPSPRASVPPPTVPEVTPVPPKIEAEGFFYEVHKGDTLWRISRNFGVTIDEIVRANRLASASRISIGLKLFIPTAEKSAALSLDDEGSFSWPVRGEIISFFGARTNYTINKGVDIACSYGTEVRPARSGRVSFVSEKVKGYGKLLIIDHREGFSTVYAYLAEINVSLGDSVSRNTVIAKAGSSGRADKPGLHFEIRKGHVPRNPFYYLP